MHNVWGKEHAHINNVWLGNSNTTVNSVLMPYFTDYNEPTPVRQYAYHCALFGDTCNLSGTLGIGALSGQTLFVAKGAIFGSDMDKVAVTYMHELGHNLSLQHGGEDDINFKPNYISIMNYLFRAYGGLIGKTGSAACDYSHYKLPDLNEGKLMESDGVDINGLTLGTGLGTAIHGKEVVPIAGAPCDFNNNGVIDTDPVEYDINGDGRINIILVGYDDWANIKYTTENSNIGKRPNSSSYSMFSSTLANSMELPECITYETYLERIKSREG